MKLTFEYDPQGEVKIYCDQAGAESLIKYLTDLIEGKDTHYHLMTPSWGGYELTEDTYNDKIVLVNQVLINIIREE